MYICVDFDGTVVTHEFPLVGKPIPLALDTLKELQNKGHDLILFTMRSGPYLEDAVKYLQDNGIRLSGINKNPTQVQWTSSPKAYGHIYIDDAALGCPLKQDPTFSTRPFVDWEKVHEILKKDGVL